MTDKSYKKAQKEAGKEEKKEGIYGDKAGKSKVGNKKLKKPKSARDAIKNQRKRQMEKLGL